MCDSLEARLNKRIGMYTASSDRASIRRLLMDCRAHIQKQHTLIEGQEELLLELERRNDVLQSLFELKQ